MASGFSAFGRISAIGGGIFAASGRAPSGFYMAPAVGTSNTEYNWNFIYGTYNMLRVCKELYASLAHESAGNTTCGRTFNTYQTKALRGLPMDKQFVLDCGPRDNDRLARYAEPGHNSAQETVSAPYAVLSLCAKTCMEQSKFDAAAPKCCFVPEQYAKLFPCCRELHCCADQIGDGWTPTSGNKTGFKRHHLRQRYTQGAAISVSVAVNVEHNGAATNVFDRLLGCLRTSNGTGSACSNTADLQGH